MARRLLIVATVPVQERELRGRVANRLEADSELLVVAPASDLSRVDWLTNADKSARANAEHRAANIAKAAETAPTRSVEAAVGDPDPVLAIEDALRTFAADELVIVTREDQDAGWLEAGSAERHPCGWRYQ